MKASSDVVGKLLTQATNRAHQGGAVPPVFAFAAAALLVWGVASAALPGIATGVGLWAAALAGIGML
ncbi:MAG: hypothetical protein EON93_17145, partial [Burkholderiales bacterium]